MTPQTTCSLAEHWIYSSLDGELSEFLEQQLERHLDACASCRERMEEAQFEQQMISSELSGLGGELEVLLEDRLTPDDIVRVTTPQEDPRARVSLRIAAAVFLAVGLGVIALVLNQADQTAQLEVARMTWSNSVSIQSHSGSTVDLEQGGERALLTGEDVVVPFGSSAQLALVDGSSVKVYGGSRFQLTIDNEVPEFYLRHGRARFAVTEVPEPTPEGLLRPTFVVATPAVIASVIGTRFDVIHDSDRLFSRVEVEEGRVRVEHRRSSLSALTLGRGESAKAFKASRMQLTHNQEAGKWEWQRKRHGQWVMQVESKELAKDPGDVDEPGSGPSFFGREPGDRDRTSHADESRPVKRPTSSKRLDLPANDDDGEE